METLYNFKLDEHEIMYERVTDHYLGECCLGECRDVLRKWASDLESAGYEGTWLDDDWYQISLADSNEELAQLVENFNDVIEDLVDEYEERENEEEAC